MCRHIFFIKKGLDEKNNKQTKKFEFEASKQVGSCCWVIKISFPDVIKFLFLLIWTTSHQNYAREASHGSPVLFTFIFGQLKDSPRNGLHIH